jgi:hypothetical protein
VASPWRNTGGFGLIHSALFSSLGLLEWGWVGSVSGLLSDSGRKPGYAANGISPTRICWEVRIMRERGQLDQTALVLIMVFMLVFLLLLLLLGMPAA